VTEAEAVKAVIDHWQAGWEALHPADPSHVDHVRWIPRNIARPNAATWVRITLQHTSSRQITQGQAPYRKWDRRGWIAVSIYVPINTGTLLASRLADHVRSVLEGKSIGGSERVVTYEGPTEELPEEGQWARSIVKVPFRYVETR
jgi:hypothetical protein